MARSIWSGAISFGLVSVPVKLYTAVRQKDVSFHQVDEKTGSRIKYKRVAEKTGREVPYERIVKGYEIEDGRYVLIDPDELEELQPEKTRRIDIEDFVDLDQIDPIFYEHTYYLAPDKGGEKAYSLLLRSMQDANKVAIGRVVIRTKQYLAAIRPYGRTTLALETMLFPDEVVDPADIDAIPTKADRVSENERKMARQLIESLSADFDPEKYKDTYRESLLKFIKKKAKGETVEVEAPEEEPSKVVDLMEALRASLEQSGGKEKRASKKRSGSRSSSRRSSGGKKSSGTKKKSA